LILLSGHSTFLFTLLRDGGDWRPLGVYKHGGNLRVIKEF
jgi:hypothetical protein